jgi:hypothetical protein
MRHKAGRTVTFRPWVGLFQYIGKTNVLLCIFLIVYVNEVLYSENVSATNA